MHPVPASSWNFSLRMGRLWSEYSFLQWALADFHKTSQSFSHPFIFLLYHFYSSYFLLSCFFSVPSATVKENVASEASQSKDVLSKLSSHSDNNNNEGDSGNSISDNNSNNNSIRGGNENNDKNDLEGNSRRRRRNDDIKMSSAGQETQHSIQW